MCLLAQIGVIKPISSLQASRMTWIGSSENGSSTKTPSRDSSKQYVSRRWKWNFEKSTPNQYDDLCLTFAWVDIGIHSLGIVLIVRFRRNLQIAGISQRDACNFYVQVGTDYNLSLQLRCPLSPLGHCRAERTMLIFAARKSGKALWGNSRIAPTFIPPVVSFGTFA